MTLVSLNTSRWGPCAARTSKLQSSKLNWKPITFGPVVYRKTWSKSLNAFFSNLGFSFAWITKHFHCNWKGTMETENNALWSRSRHRWAYSTLQHHQWCLTTERTNSFSVFRIKLIQNNDATKFCHKFIPALATMFGSWSSLIMPVMILFCALNLSAVVLCTSKAKGSLKFCPQNRAHLAKLNLIVHTSPTDFYWTHHPRDANQWAQLISEFLFLQLC